ncbi:M15 family metallopeptidase [Cellulomonas rhizosphaerae]|uniref:D-alanyl-D-alanine carboxypeptidase-like core domain-containing protein n=1 Tax=Cellulomonas rhizosphaerae TaxID=2293719 RepID=A0A413RK94_9CELL|nr:M15 family metallopeptidase [Cellulomonas rhizosphaerae]RHA39512.1 hypothetical protein D1825_11700 [Cellulomonas rhizosphaerae]
MISRPAPTEHHGVPSWTSGAAAHPGRSTSAPRTTHGAFVSGADRPDAVGPRPAPRGTASGHTAHGVTSSLDPRAAMPPSRTTPEPVRAPEPEHPRPTAFSTARYGVRPPAGRAESAPAGFVPAQVNGSWQSDIRAVDARLVRETPAGPTKDESAKAGSTTAKPTTAKPTTAPPSKPASSTGAPSDAASTAPPTKADATKAAPTSASATNTESTSARPTQSRPAQPQPRQTRRAAAAPSAPLYPATAPEEQAAAAAAPTAAIPTAAHPATAMPAAAAPASTPAFPAVAPESVDADEAAPETQHAAAKPAATPQPGVHQISRAMRRQAAPAAHPKKSRHRPARAATRLGVLTALAAVTVVIPVSQGAIAGTAVISGEPLTNATFPSTVSALTAAQPSMLPPASLVPTDGAVSVRALAAAASRDETRSLLPGCNPATRAPGSNGLLAEKDLCTLWDGHTRLRADAASSLAEFNAAYVARFGADMCLASGYRTLAEQRSVKATRGGLAAAPGKSNHGWGLATDFCSQLTYGERWTWINANAPTFGWENPAWAKPGGSGPFEKWHWEYTKGVKADGEYYG